ncbi:MAG: 3-hydroxy-3-methylglutaryl-coenzyme A reductase [Haliscomenobacter sp.]|jgi:hydroxymethylglutaryl-CoA reductase|nr:3-hydroxy-3-methylglutaryl-coenzyme A reductase [Haliscomenobacter sp.]
MADQNNSVHRVAGDHKKRVEGFSKLTREEKVAWIAQGFLEPGSSAGEQIASFLHSDAGVQRILSGLSENTLCNFPMPYGIAPNFLINDEWYAVPMVIEESSVVAAASSAAKFWSARGGFLTKVLSTVKLGQVHFSYKGNKARLFQVQEELTARLRAEAVAITANMEQRGGGVLGIDLLDFTHLEPDYYQLLVRFETCDSMGANFINSVLEQFGRSLVAFVETHAGFEDTDREVDIIMAILSNFTPECIVHAEVSCPVEALEGACEHMDGPAFAEKFRKAVRIAEIDPYRATTHNKGIFNGVDAVVLASGNDFRAVEACGHAYAAKDGQYRSLSYCTVENGVFRFWMDLPLALGTVGGLTKLHPLAGLSLDILGNPSAPKLMEIIAATGLAQNFAALRSLVTTGIQKGHMKMHLQNILHHLGATDQEARAVQAYFEDKVVSFSSVREFLQLQRIGGIIE